MSGDVSPVGGVSLELSGPHIAGYCESNHLTAMPPHPSLWGLGGGSLGLP